MKVSFYTLGCKVNQQDTQAMAEAVIKAGHEVVDFAPGADAYVINTCTVTATGDKKARQMIGRAQRMGGGAVIIVCGCLPQRNPEAVLRLPGVDAVAGTNARTGIANIIIKAKKGNKLNFVGEIAKQDEFEDDEGTLGERTRAYIKVQDGCDRYCTYCIIPYTRGPLRSRFDESIKRQARSAAQSGHREIVLTGIRLTAFGQGEGRDLADAVKLASAPENILRVRLGSLDPDDMTGELIEKLSECEKLCPHFHLSLQSGSDTVLKRMGRRYTAEEYAEKVGSIRKLFPEAAFTTDIMCGFAGETEEEFLETCAFVRRIGFARIHVFPYSRREGTAADRLPGHLPASIRLKRAKELIEIGEGLEESFVASLAGTHQQVIFETGGEEGFFEGYTANYLKVRARAAQAQGKAADVLITGAEGKTAAGEIIRYI